MGAKRAASGGGASVLTVCHKKDQVAPCRLGISPKDGAEGVARRYSDMVSSSITVTTRGMGPNFRGNEKLPLHFVHKAYCPGGHNLLFLLAASFK